MAPSPTAASQSPAALDELPLRISLAVLFFTYWCVDIVSPALPAMQQSLALSATAAGLVFSVFFAGRLVTNVPAAWLIGRVGPRWTAVAGAAALLAGSLLAGTATSEAVLLPARGMQGAGVAVLATAGLLSALRALPAGGAAMTAFNVSSSVGSSAGLGTGGLLTSLLGWQAVFWLSSLLSGILLAGSLLTRSTARQLPSSRPVRAVPERPISPSRGRELGAIAANLLVFTNYSIWVVSLPLLGAEKFGLDAGQVGLMLLFVIVIHLASAFPTGVFIRRVGPAPALALSLAIAGAGMLLIPLAPSPLWLAAPLALYAAGQVAGNSSAGDLVLRVGGGGGRAVGAVRLTSDVGLVAGPAAAGALADYAGVEAPFVAFGVMALAGMLCAAVLTWGRTRRCSGRP
jgi:MFS family permease